MSTLMSGDDKNKTNDVPLNLQSTGVKSASLFENLQLYVFGLIAFSFFLAGIYALSKIQGLKEKLTELMNSIIAATFYNGIIRSLSISFLDTSLTAYANSTSTVAEDNYQGWGVYFVLISYIIFLIVFIARKQPQLRKRESLKSFGMLFN